VKTATVVFGGPSNEHDISILTGLQCERLLARAGVAVSPIYWDRTQRWHLVSNETEARDYLDGPPPSSTELELRVGSEPGFYKRQRFGAKRFDGGPILNCMHGGAGEGGGAQSLFELLHVPATGGTVYSASLCMDKLAFAAVAALAGVPTLPRLLVTQHSDRPSFEGPFIVKPRFGGSSIGIEVVEDFEAAQTLAGGGVAFRAGAVLEPYRTDLFDINLAFRTYPSFEISAIERPIRSGGSIYSFTEKYLHTSGLTNAPRELPARISDDLTARMHSHSATLAAHLGITGIVRLDYLTDGVTLFANEANSIPGAMAIFLWTDDDASQVLLDALAEAETLADFSSQIDRGKGEALRAAGGIAGKLSGLPANRGRQR